VPLKKQFSTRKLKLMNEETIVTIATMWDLTDYPALFVSRRIIMWLLLSHLLHLIGY
jgi:hypothetical protein